MTITPGGNPVCPECGRWYGPGADKKCPHATAVELCNFFWGSHGCDLPKDNHRVHRCGHLEPTTAQLELVESGDLDPRVLGPCCEYDEDRPADARVRWTYDSAEDVPYAWGDWHEYGEGWRM